MKLYVRSLVAALSLLAFSHCFAETFQGPGVFPFSGTVTCPFLVGSEQNVCRQLALIDGNTRAEVLLDKHEIQLSNTGDYADKTLVADVFLPATAKDEKGQVVPLILHVKVSREGHEPMTVRAHSHAPVVGVFSEIKMESWKIMAGSRVLFTEEQAKKTLENPSLAARLTHEFVDVQDNRLSGQPNKPDITVRLGLGKKKNIPVMRSQLDAPGVHDLENLYRTLHSGTWSITLESLSNFIPRRVTRHDLFLYGLHQQPLLENIYKEGFRKGQRIVIGAKDGVGYLQVEGKQLAFPGAGDAATRYLNLSFIGLILAWHQINPR